MNAQISSGEITRIKEMTKISEIIGRYVDWDRKKSNFGKGDYWACCPFHGESTPSFHCEDKKGQFYCFGCNVKGDSIEFLQQHVGLTFIDAVKELGGDVATQISPEREKELQDKREADIAKRQAEQEMSDEQRMRIARATFKRGIPIKDTIAEKYLISRGIPEQIWDPDRFRFCEAIDLDCEPFGRRAALVAAATNPANEITALWRIYLTPDGQALRDERGHSIKMGKGPAAGSAVVLGKITSTMGVVEGVETGFGVRALTQNRIGVLAGLSTSGMIGLQIPKGIRHLQIYADGDSARFHKEKFNLITPPGLHAARSLEQRAISEGRTATIELPPVNSDWLDVWNTVRGEYV